MFVKNLSANKTLGVHFDTNVLINLKFNGTGAYLVTRMHCLRSCFMQWFVAEPILSAIVEINVGIFQDINQGY